MKPQTYNWPPLSTLCINQISYTIPGCTAWRLTPIRSSQLAPKTRQNVVPTLLSTTALSVRVSRGSTLKNLSPFRFYQLLQQQAAVSSDALPDDGKRGSTEKRCLNKNQRIVGHNFPSREELSRFVYGPIFFKFGQPLAWINYDNFGQLSIRIKFTVLLTYLSMYLCMYVPMSFIAGHPRAFQIQEQGERG